MSEIVYDKHGLRIYKYHGGVTRGRCFQIETSGYYTQMTEATWKEVVNDLKEMFLEGDEE